MFEIFLTSSAFRDYKLIPESEVEHINKAIDALTINPRPRGYKKLKNRDAFRIRSGNYRIIYEIKDNTLIIIVVRIRHRKEVYRGL
ncbi:MAG TPA: type II toxin-antitoxin system RelE/ParE family toxin [Spirochaetota bacterium]|nr:type II toxin-antitoxin system RelE/ParE family toxin [Spirochaetota bacterium]HRZ29023.1 type II toxin-antitoxin system RelE/ParE family toxin [Spirochaetota bacterium]HSA13833.1 type II toxin-antitoxin system RelE/ParE family toxin [Spirochaetota bacterium]